MAEKQASKLQSASTAASDFANRRRASYTRLLRPPPGIQGMNAEPWVVLANNADLQAWGRDEEIAYKQTSRQIEKVLFFRRSFDFLIENRVHGDYFEFGCHRCRTFRMALTEGRQSNLQDTQFNVSILVRRSARAD